MLTRKDLKISTEGASVEVLELEVVFVERSLLDEVVLDAEAGGSVKRVFGGVGVGFVRSVRLVVEEGVSSAWS